MKLNFLFIHIIIVCSGYLRAENMRTINYYLDKRCGESHINLTVFSVCVCVCLC